MAVVEGVARVVSVLPPNEASTAGLMLVQPFIDRCQQALQALQGVRGVSVKICWGLS